MLVAQAPAPTIRSGNSGLLGGFRIESFNVPIKAGHGTSHSTDFNWPRLLPPTGPSQSGVSYIERWSVSNPGSHHRESSALPTELRDFELIHSFGSLSCHPFATLSYKSLRLKVFSSYHHSTVTYEQITQMGMHVSTFRRVISLVTSYFPPEAFQIH